MSNKIDYIRIPFRREIGDKFKSFLSKNSKNHSDGAAKIMRFFKETGYDVSEPENAKIASVDIDDMERKILEKQERIIKIQNAHERDYLKPFLELSKASFSQRMVSETPKKDDDSVLEALQKENENLRNKVLSLEQNSTVLKVDFKGILNGFFSKFKQSRSPLRGTIYTLVLTEKEYFDLDKSLKK